MYTQMSERIGKESSETSRNFFFPRRASGNLFVKWHHFGHVLYAHALMFSVNIYLKIISLEKQHYSVFLFWSVLKKS
jgi:hypothetical protein